MAALEATQAAEDQDAATDFARALVALAPALRAFLRRLNAAEVDDLVQETWARAWRSRATYRPASGDLVAWLLRIAFRVYLDGRAERRRRPDRLDDNDRLAAAPADLAALRDELGKALGRLTDPEREVVLRFHRDRQRIAEIAKALGMPVGTVKSHLHRARCKLTCGDGGER